MKLICRTFSFFLQEVSYNHLLLPSPLSEDGPTPEPGSSVAEATATIPAGVATATALRAKTKIAK